MKVSPLQATLLQMLDNKTLSGYLIDEGERVIFAKEIDPSDLASLIYYTSTCLNEYEIKLTTDLTKDYLAHLIKLYLDSLAQSVLEIRTSEFRLLSKKIVNLSWQLAVLGDHYQLPMLVDRYLEEVFLPFVNWRMDRLVSLATRRSSLVVYNTVLKTLAFGLFPDMNQAREGKPAYDKRCQERHDWLNRRKSRLPSVDPLSQG